MPSPLQPFPRHHRRDPWRPADCPRRTGRTLLETLPGGVTNSYQYTVTANTHAIETNVYDLRNRLTSRTDATGKPTTYQYDANDNLVQATDRKGQVTTLQYDALNRPSQISDADGRITQYSYDLAGNLAHIADSQSGDIVLNYDTLENK